MFDFVPPKFIDLRAAVRRACLAWYGPDILGGGLTEREAEDLLMHKTAAAYMGIADEQGRQFREMKSSFLSLETASVASWSLPVQRNQELSQKSPNASAIYRDAWIRLRSALADGAVASSVVDKVTGSLWSLKPAAWNAATAGNVHIHGLMRASINAETCVGLVVLWRSHFETSLKTGSEEHPTDDVASNNRDATDASVRAETQCRRWLIDLMKDAPDARSQKKADYLAKARRYFSVTDRAFDRAWRAALGETGAKWNAAGAPKKTKS